MLQVLVCAPGTAATLCSRLAWALVSGGSAKLADVEWLWQLATIAPSPGRGAHGRIRLLEHWSLSVGQSLTQRCESEDATIRPYCALSGPGARARALPHGEPARKQTGWLRMRAAPTRDLAESAGDWGGRAVSCTRRGRGLRKGSLVAGTSSWAAWEPGQPGRAGSPARLGPCRPSNCRDDGPSRCKGRVGPCECRESS